MAQAPKDTQRSYRRGAVMGITMAEAFVLICFALLLLFAYWQLKVDENETPAIVEFRKLDDTQQKNLLEETPKEVLEFSKLTPSEQQIVLEALKDGTLTTFTELSKNGVDFSVLGPAPNPDGTWRFIDKKEAQRLFDAASRLPEDVKRSLAEIVETKDVREILEQMKVLEDLAAKGKSLEDISKKLNDAETHRESLARTLKSELGEIVTSMGGKFDVDGAIILPDAVLFEVGESTPKQGLLTFLRSACEPWLTTLKNASTPISEIRIEGHASSEWTKDATKDEAYLGNLDLSSKRSEVVLQKCLEYVPDPNLKDWAQRHLVSLGYSSTRPVTKDGIEDQSASRRVVFVAIPDRESLIDEIGAEVQKTSSGYDRTLFDGDDDICNNTRQKTLRKRTTAPFQTGGAGCSIVAGQWLDSYNGVQVTDATTIEIDHLVPLKWAWDRGADQWLKAKREAFHNDDRNLFVTAKGTNREKGFLGPRDWLPENQTFRCSYIRSFQSLTKDYGLTPSEKETNEIQNLLTENCN